MNLPSRNAHASTKKFGKASVAAPTRISGVQGSCSLKKPSRPLTAFHIFSQLEKEYIMQRPDGGCDEVSGERHGSARVNNNSLPRRYQSLDIPTDWCESPGKRKKRKHRKTSSSSRSIDFVEMSRMIAARWAELDDVDTETKLFCQNVAEQKLFEYREDLKKYKAALEERVSIFSGEKALTHQVRDGSSLCGAKRFIDEYKSGSPQPSEVHCTNPSVDLESLFKKNDLEIDQCIKYFKSSQSSCVLLNVPRSSPRRLVSPCDSFASALIKTTIPSNGTRYGMVDIDDSEIIAMFTNKKNQDVSRVDLVSRSSYQSSDDQGAARFLSVCHPCML
ncbi:hypothetical protein HJC23_005245 [Cyclotella cryptica]|uniref:HMG box domain-containing protein n=1 Tax=Cyclotella cryptica TaxID=29204 RepID=A0ABD3PMP7_9STRA|eukprot:CCRYP_013569-RA/>CCRYP_013569-RA protein AED:0.00 eAED:0.00 QI:424/1/1/1/0/0/2/579/332